MEMERSQERITLLIVSIAAFLIPFMGSSLSLALPLIQNDFQLDVVLLGWIPTAFVLANAAFILPLGRLADIHGRKRIFGYGVAIYTLASVLAGLATSGEILVLFSFLQGLGCSLLFATAIALLSSVYPPERRGGALGLYIASVYIGLLLGPLLGGFLAQNLGWRSIFLFNIPIGIFLLFLILWKLSGEWKGAAGEKFDIPGSLLYVPAVVLLFYGFTTLQGQWGAYLLGFGLLVFICFLWVEEKSTHPILPLQIFRNRVASLSGSSALILQTGTSALYTLLSLYLQDLKGFSTVGAALLLAVQPLLTALLSPLVGRLADRTENCYLAAGGMAITTMGLIFLLYLSQNTSIFILILGLALLGLGAALFASPANRNFLGAVDRRIYGQAAATFSTMIFSGQTLSLGIFLLILNHYMGQAQINPSNYNLFMDGYQAILLVFTIVCGVGVVVSLLSKGEKCAIEQDLD